MKLAILIFMLFAGQGFCQLPTPEGSQQKQLNKISRRAQTVPEDYSYSTYFLANYLTKSTNTDLEKIWGFYVWIANNITYDMKGFKANNYPDYRPKAVLHNKLAVCEGYARLFNELCAEAGIRCEIIRGYSKGYDYEVGDKFEISNHAWNAIYLDGKWVLVDVTWAARNANNTRIVRPFSDEFFLVDPESFIKDHLPEIPSWQLLSKPISKKDFENGVIIISKGDYNFTDSLSQILEMNQSRRAITYQLQARKFNPDNDATNYKLGVEYRFRALDSLDAISKVKEENKHRFKALRQSVYADLDEAALYFSLIKPSSGYYESSQNFLDDTDFERGVFNYELAHRLIEFYNTFSEEKKDANRVNYEKQILMYYTLAGEYFELIPIHSWYYESAQNYLKFYLDNPFAEG